MSVSLPFITRFRRKSALGVSGATVLQVNRVHVHTGGASTLTLPVGARFGDQITIVGNGSAIFTIGQNALQSIRHLTSNTTVGTGGTLAAGTVRDAITLVCTSTDGTQWTSTSVKGTFVVV